MEQDNIFHSCCSKETWIPLEDLNTLHYKSSFIHSHTDAYLSSYLLILLVRFHNLCVCFTHWYGFIKRVHIMEQKTLTSSHRTVLFLLKLSVSAVTWICGECLWKYNTMLSFEKPAGHCFTQTSLSVIWYCMSSWMKD